MNSVSTMEEEVRCQCARLLARWTKTGYELKCGRCKTVWRLPLVPGGDLVLVCHGPHERMIS